MIKKVYLVKDNIRWEIPPRIRELYESKTYLPPEGWQIITEITDNGAVFKLKMTGESNV